MKKTSHINKLRHVYHMLSQPAKVVSLRVGAQTAQFWVPNRSLQIDIDYFTEASQLQAFLGMLHKDDVVWDVGANCGVYSMFAAQRISRGQVFCFEPQRGLQKIIKINRFLNDVREKVTILPIALGNSSGHASFYESAVTMGTHSLVARSDAYHSKGTAKRIKVFRADDLVRHGTVSPPTAIKLDVEGAEYDVCAGLKGLMSTSAPRLLFIEVHPWLLGGFGSTVDDLQTLLTEYGYCIQDGGIRGTEYYWFATKNRNAAVEGCS